MAKLKVSAKFSNPKIVEVYVVEIGWKKKTKHPHLVAQKKATRIAINAPWTAVFTTHTPKPGRKNTLRVIGLSNTGEYLACSSIPVRGKKWP